MKRSRPCVTPIRLNNEQKRDVNRSFLDRKKKVYRVHDSLTKYIYPKYEFLKKHQQLIDTNNLEQHTVEFCFRSTPSLTPINIKKGIEP